MFVTSTQLHPSQSEVYWDQLINTDIPHYNIGGYISLKGDLVKEKFYEAVNSAAKVFDAFKMRFSLDEADAQCYIEEEYDKVEMSELDFSKRENPFQDALSWMQNRFNTPFLIQKENLLFEHALLKVANDEHWLFGRYHHLITDGYGFIVFVQYVAQKYKSLIAENDQEFIYPSYIDEIEKASEYFDSAAYESDSKYWKEKIFKKPTKILQKKYLQNDSGKSSTTYVLRITEEQKALLQEIQTATMSGLQQLTIAALLIYFGKISDQSEFIFGIPIHKRGSRKLRNIVGMFSGILPFKGIFQKDCKLVDHIREITNTQKRDYRHQNYPIGELSRELKVNPSEGYLHEISIHYELLNFELNFGMEIQASISRLFNEFDKSPLQLSWCDYGSTKPLELQIHFIYEYFSMEEIELLSKRILYILEQFSKGLSKTIESIDILPLHERRLLEKFNDTSAQYPDDKTIIDLFEEQVSSNPDSIAVEFGQKQLTYRELNVYSNQLAHYLKSKGIKEDAIVPIIIERSLEMIIGIMGILKSGSSYVPIDPEYPSDRVRYILRDTGANMILCSKKTVTKLEPGKENSIIELDRDWSIIINQPKKIFQASPKPHNLAYIIYTSGSTGHPKGVMIEHRAVVNLINAQSIFFKISSDDRILQFSNYSFDASVEQIFLAILNGACLVLFPEGLQLNPVFFEDYLNEKKITHLHATPSFLENLNSIENKYLKRVIAGGDVCKKSLWQNWKNKVAFYNEYGPTETTVTAIEYSNNYNIEKNISLPIGKPLANIQIHILNKENEIQPVGVAGELCIAGDCLARGYINRPELTAEMFVKHPFNELSTARIYKTGDFGRWLPDGNIEYLGRTDEQIKIRGYRIELGEIESNIYQSRLVQHVVVLARENQEGSKQLVSYVVANHEFDKDLMITYLRSKLPEYMIPAIWVQLERLPLTFNGKIDKKALPVPDLSDLISNIYEAPGNELESKIVELWKELLDLDKADKVGINDNFFELGGHSLNAIQLISRLHKLLNIKIDISIIFSHPTIKELSHALILEKQNQFIEIKPLGQQEYYKLSHVQKRFWVLSHFKDGSEVYNVSNAFLIEGNLNADAFKQAFDAVMERHEILRTVFIEKDGEPYQKILLLNELNFNIAEIDLRITKNSEKVIKDWIKEDARRSFDLEKGPLLRATLFREADEKYTLAFNIHHIISDGWSKGIFIKEFFYFYKLYCAKIESDLSPLPIQYKDYTSWHNNSYEIQGKYWREIYEKNIPVLNFPIDFERPKVLSFFGAMLHKQVPESLTQSLHKMAVENKMSLNNLLFALYGLIVARYSNQEDIVIGSLSSGRSHIDLENLIGVFINFLPVRLSPQRHLTLSEYLSNSQSTLIKSYSNQDYPFDLMVDEYIKQRDISRNPFFDTMVNFHLQNVLKSQVNFVENGIRDTGINVKPCQSIQEELFQSVLDFKLDIEPEDKMLNFYLSYNNKLFTEQRMKTFLDEFVELLSTVVKEPNSYLTQYGNWNDEGAAVKKIQIDEHENIVPTLSVNLCASFVTEPLQEYMEYWNNELELNLKISFAPYNQVFQQLIDSKSMLNENKGLNILFIRIEDWLRDQAGLSASEQINFLNQTYSELINAIENLRKITFIPFLVGIVPVYPNTSFASEVVAHIKNLNQELESFLKKLTSFQLLDLDKVASLYDIKEIYDPDSDRMGHMPFTPENYAALGTYLTRKVNAFKGPSYKVIALDCDNTLWKGVCGEAEANEIIIDENFIQLQEFFLEKYYEGFLLVLCSKNNEEDVWEIFEKHPEMKIKREHIASHRINWEPKADNLLAISRELNLSMNSIIFVDDSEFETEQMSLSCPDVLSLTLPKESNSFLSFLNHVWAFDYFRTTEEDKNRNQMYMVEKQRKEEQDKYDSLSDFLKSLNIKINIRPLDEKDIERAVQLSMRTNQFNLNGIRKTPEDIAKSIREQNTINWIIEVKDRFGDYGVVGLVLAKETSDALELGTFHLSCRVLGRNVEDFVLSELKNYCLTHGLNTIKSLFASTSKNKPFQEFLTRTKWVSNPQTSTYNFLLKKDDNF